MGIPPGPRRTDEARPGRSTVHTVGDPACRGHRSGTSPVRPDLAAVPVRLGRRDPHGRLLARGYLAAEKTVRTDLHRVGTRWMHLGGVTSHPPASEPCARNPIADPPRDTEPPGRAGRRASLYVP